MSVLAERRRHNVFRVAVVYSATAFVVVQVGGLPVDLAAAPGDRERTPDLLAHGIERPSAVLLGIGADRLYAFVAREPRFVALRVCQNLPQAWPPARQP